MNRTRLALTPVLLLAIPLFAAAGPATVPAAAATTSPTAADNRNDDDRLRKYVVELRSELTDGKTKAINEIMQLSNEEAKVFWPIYHDYEEELFANGDKRLELIKKYVTLYADRSMTNGNAKEIAAEWFDFQEQQLAILKKYHAEIQEKLSPVRASQFVQIEHRFSLVVDLMIASELPLVEHNRKAANARSALETARP